MKHFLKGVNPPDYEYFPNGVFCSCGERFDDEILAVNIQSFNEHQELEIKKVFDNEYEKANSKLKKANDQVDQMYYVGQLDMWNYIRHELNIKKKESE